MIALAWYRSSRVLHYCQHLATYDCKKKVCGPGTDFEDLKGNGIYLFVVIPHMSPLHQSVSTTSLMFSVLFWLFSFPVSLFSSKLHNETSGS